MGLGSTLKKAAGAVVGSVVGGPGGLLSGATDGFSGGVSGLSGWDFVSGAVGLGQDVANAELAYDYQKRAADYAYGKNLEMWNLQNAYNDPAAQMARLKNAGLNPNLVYGGGNVTGNTSSSGPEYKLDGNVYQSKQMQREQLQLAMKEHQQRVTNQAIENDLARQRLILAEREANRSDALAAAQIKAYEANLGLVDTNIGNIGFQQAEKKKEFAYKQYKADLDAWQQRYNQNYNKFAARLNEAKEVRRVMAIVGRRPMLMDYLNR